METRRMADKREDKGLRGEREERKLKIRGHQAREKRGGAGTSKKTAAS